MTLTEYAFALELLELDPRSERTAGFLGIPHKELLRMGNGTAPIDHATARYILSWVRATACSGAPH